MKLLKAPYTLVAYTAEEGRLPWFDFQERLRRFLIEEDGFHPRYNDIQKNFTLYNDTRRRLYHLYEKL